MLKYSKYTQGLQMNQFKLIDKISSYNYNYYIGFDKDLLFALSDDDNTTEWWVISNLTFHYLGESYTSEGDLLNVFEKRCT